MGVSWQTRGLGQDVMDEIGTLPFGTPPVLIREYAAFVSRTDQFKGLDKDERKRIAIYGLSSEIGSIVSAVKKQRLKEGGALSSRLAKDELRDEIGDVIWYCFVLAQIEGVSTEPDILALQIERLAQELDDTSPRGELFRKQLSPERLAAFRTGAAEYPTKLKRSFGDFQDLAYNTARTQDGLLLDVCLSVLTQLAAQLMRQFLTSEERELNKEVNDREIVAVLGEVAWHLAALASLYSLKLGDIIIRNKVKLEDRQPDGPKTPLHDAGDKEKEQLPRQFQVKFITIGNGRSRMYWNGAQLGNELKDNAAPDGYRFHDVVHLAHIAHLGWSPVMRALMKRKRKNDDIVDEHEDGARARIVEESIIKMVHAEGIRIAEINSPGVPRERLRLFPETSDISFSLLRQIRTLTDGIEVSRNKLWEWKNAIHDGFYLYHELCRHGQGTVTVDMDMREISFSPHVYVDIVGTVSSVGASALDLIPANEALHTTAAGALTQDELAEINGENREKVLQFYTVKQAILQAAGIDPTEAGIFHELQLHALSADRYSVRVSGAVQSAFWKRKIVAVKVSQAVSQSSIYCSALAVCDPAPI